MKQLVLLGMFLMVSGMTFAEEQTCPAGSEQPSASTDSGNKTASDADAKVLVTDNKDKK